jgi:hypothetical protein
MKASSRALLLLALLSLLPQAQAQAQAQEPSSDAASDARAAAMEAERKKLLGQVRDACLPQLEQESRAFLKATLPATEVSLKLSDNLGGSALSLSLSVYMDADCANKDVCDTATVTLQVPQPKQPDACKPTRVSFLNLSWNATGLWRELQKDNPLVKVRDGSGKAFQLKKKQHRLKELLERIRKKNAHELEADGEQVGCSIEPESTRATCMPLIFVSKETGGAEYNLAFDILKKQGKWTLAPNSLGFQDMEL